MQVSTPLRSRVTKSLFANLVLLIALGCSSYDNKDPADGASSATALSAADTVAAAPTAAAPTAAGSATKAAGQTNVLFEGPITGFGSVIINRVRFNDNGAAIHDDEDGRLARSDLRLGTVVQVTGSADSAGSGSAVKIAVMPTLRGRIESIDTNSNSLVVLEQRVQIDSATVLEGSSTSNPLKAGDWVEVHGISGNNIVAATLIERKAGSNQSMLRGVISNLNAAAKTFSIGSLLVSFANADLRPSAVTLQNGQFVNVRAHAEPQAGQLVAAKIRVRAHGATQQGGAESFEFKGIVESMPDAAGQFMVSNVKIEAASKAMLPKGGFVIGQRLQIKGSYRDDVLVAQRIDAENPAVNPASERNRLLGTVASRVGKDFTVNGVAVDASQARIDGGSIDTLAAGALVEVNGHTVNGDRGTVVNATRVRIAQRSVKTDAHASDRPQQLYGSIHGFASVGQFNLNGTKVDASRARFAHGDASKLANEVYVEINGSLVNGVLIASEVEFSKTRSTAVPATATPATTAPAAAPAPATPAAS